MSKYIVEIPPLYYFNCGNDFTGSNGEMSFKISLSDNLKISIWKGKLCFNKAEILELKEVPADDSGYILMREYIDSKSAEINKG